MKVQIGSTIDLGQPLVSKVTLLRYSICLQSLEQFGLSRQVAM